MRSFIEALWSKSGYTIVKPIETEGVRGLLLHHCGGPTDEPSTLEIYEDGLVQASDMQPGSCFCLLD
jgi:hypothetical protein